MLITKAPCEAEAQCAALVKGGKAFAVGTEDMDALTFGSTTVLRHLTFSEARWVDVEMMMMMTTRVLGLRRGYIKK